MYLVMRSITRNKSKDMFAGNHDNGSEWNTYLPTDCCFREIALENSHKCVGLVQNEHHHHLIEK